MRLRPNEWMHFNRRLPILLLISIAAAAQCAFCQRTGASSSIDGAAIFAQNCAKCHGDKGEGVKAMVSMAGPPLQAVHDRELILERVREGKGVMPTFGRLLSSEQIEAVADYVLQAIAVMPLKGGDLSTGGTLFRLYCAACHRTAVRGGALAFAGINAPALTGKTPSTIAGAIRFGPGPMPAFPASVLDDKQVASIVEYVEFMQRPPSPGGDPLNFYGPVAEGLTAWITVFILVFITGWIEKGGKG